MTEPTTFEKAQERLAERRHALRRKVLPEGVASLGEAVLAYEASLIKKALLLEGGAIVAAAEDLGISYQQLRFLLDGRQKELAGFARTKRRRSIITVKSSGFCNLLCQRLSNQR